MTTSLRLKQEDRERLQAIHQLITKDASKHFTIEQMALEAGINRTKLQYGFKQLYGYGIFEYQAQLRMEMAETMLLETDYTIKRIAMLTGYKYKSNFTKAFKKK